MKEQRIDSRLLCADLVPVEWIDLRGAKRQSDANLEDISASGACLQVDEAVPPGSTIRIKHRRTTLTGMVKYCVYRDIGYFLGVQFDEETKWSPKLFKPMHLLDPRRLASRLMSRLDD